MHGRKNKNTGSFIRLAFFLIGAMARAVAELA